MENQLNAGTKAIQGSREKLSKEIGGIVNETTDLLKHFGTQKLESAEAALSQAQTAVTDGAKKYAGMTHEYVHANPWKSLGVAAAAGLLIGILLARR